DATTGTSVALVRSNQAAPRTLLSHGISLANAPAWPTTLTSTQVLEILPVNPLDSVSRLYRVTVGLEHVEVPGHSAVQDHQVVLPEQRLLDFSGRLFFGQVETRMEAILNHPVPGYVIPNGVSSSLAVAVDGGTIAGHSGYRFGSGNELAVLLRPTGDAEYRGAATLPVRSPSPDTNTVANVRIRRTELTLRSTGAFADVQVWLPSGVGYRFNKDSRILQGTLTFNGRSLDQNLAPADRPRLTAPALYLCEESKPVWFEGTELSWDVAEGRFLLKSTGLAEYVRRSEVDRLRAAPVAEAEKEKKSNELVFATIQNVTRPEVVIRAHTDGSARLTFDAELKPGAFTTHFPYATRVESREGGPLSVDEDLILPASSGLVEVDPIRVSYGQGCSEPDCSGPAESAGVVLEPKAGELRFTSDGGLTAGGEVVDPQELAWGRIETPGLGGFAQRVGAFGEARFFMPGSFLRGDVTELEARHRPGVLLLEGVNPGDAAVLERFGMTQYTDGGGDYAGLNFRLGRDGERAGRSVLGGHETGNYPLSRRSKYYVRPGGVSGIHEAVTGAKPDDAKIYGYDFHFSNYGLSYLDSGNHESRTSGSIGVGGPSHFTINFEELRFTCLGGLDWAKVPESETNKVLEYWQADIKPLAIQFDRPASAACDPSKGFLTLGVEAWAQHVEAALYGQLGWHSSGNLITLQDRALDPPFDSRLKLPNSFPIQGPDHAGGHETYAFTPVNDAYYNNWEHAPSDTGFMNIAGKLDVPFFEDLRVHLHTSADRDAPASPVFLMGGWPDRGFEVDGHNFFDANPADPDNRGVPADTTVAGYRVGNTDRNGKYLVRARRRWIDAIDLDFPLRWSDSTRAFTGFESVESDLRVLRVESEARYLSAENAELVFGVQYAGLPQLNLANLSFSAAGGLAEAFSGPVLAPARDAIEAGTDHLDEMLSDRIGTFFDPTFDTLLDPVIDALYQALRSDYRSHGGAFSGGSPAPIIAAHVRGGGNSIVNRLRGLVDGASTPEQVDVLRHLDTNLVQVGSALGQIRLLLGRDPNGHRANLASLIRNIVGELAGNYAGAFGDAVLSPQLAASDPSLAQIQANLEDLLDAIEALRAGLQPGREFRSELQANLNGLGDVVTQVAGQFQSDTDSIFGEILVRGDDPFSDYTPEELKARLRQKLEDRFLASVLASSFQRILKQRMYDLDAAIREGIDSVFQQVNRVIREVISQSLVEADSSIIPFLDDCRQVLGAGRINGYAHLNGDALRLLRLDLSARLKAASDLEFDGFLQIRELTSEGTPSVCLPKGGRALEVTLGANDAEVRWIQDGLRATATGKFTFDTTSGRPTLANLGGGLDLTGEIDFEIFQASHLAAWMAFGALENYLSAAASVGVNGYQGSGGLFFGRSCSPEPLSWDPEVASVVGHQSFSGAYGYADVWLPLSEALLGIPASCVFEVSAGVGVGAGYFQEGPTYVGRMLADAEGEVLCIATLHGELNLVGVKNADGLHLKGGGRMSGKLGCCPFCVRVSRHVDVEYKHGSWDIDF
ncbi:MAG: hypothetical protein JNK85_30400, partial [Verrucomicrobiales bacterium]|nr:hypothetical protein [Verrucomicrobiales bacterium]